MIKIINNNFLFKNSFIMFIIINIMNESRVACKNSSYDEFRSPQDIFDLHEFNIEKKLIPFTENEIEKQNRDLINLEKEVNDIALLYKELDILVEIQGESIDNISENIDNTKENIINTEDILIDSNNIQSSYSKKLSILAAGIAGFVILLWKII
jgi:hypothetical protein